MKKGKAKKAKTISALVSKSADDFSHAGEWLKKAFLISLLFKINRYNINLKYL